MKCPRCGANLPAGATSCGSCGAKFQQGKRCPNCQSVIPSNAAVCPKCGARFAGQAAGIPVQKPPKVKGGFRWWYILIGLVLFLSGFGLGLVVPKQTAQTPDKPQTDSQSHTSSFALSSSTSQPKPLHMEGSWKQINSNSATMYQMALITENTIEIYWINTTEESRALYWSGSFEIPENPGERFTWTSQNDTTKTNTALLASSDTTKVFTYENGQIFYEVSAMGTTATVRLEKAAQNENFEASSSSLPSSSSEQASDVPQEYQNALDSAQRYSQNMHMSKQGIYDQLISEYGDKFSTEAAQYAVDNLKADYKANALEKAKTYYNNMSMSKEAIRNQLISEYGEKFTEEEADYAVQNLE